MLKFDVSKYDKGKPKVDVSMITDYDQRYLENISKIFYKDLPGWNAKDTWELNNILARGGRIAAYWERMRLSGAAVWQPLGDDWQLTHIALKHKIQRAGHGRAFVDYVLFKIQEEAPESALFVDADVGSVGFFTKCGFAKD